MKKIDKKILKSQEGRDLRVSCFCGAGAIPLDCKRPDAPINASTSLV